MGMKLSSLNGYHGPLVAGLVKDYCKQNNLFFLYKYIMQYSSSYWCKNRLELLNRISCLDNSELTLWNATIRDKNDVITWRGKDELNSIQTSELRRLNNLIRGWSFGSLCENENDNYYWKAYTWDDRKTNKYRANKEWAREYIRKENFI